MIINFRQGIISAQTPNFIQLVNGKVNINVDVSSIDITFAFSSYDYLFTESEQVIGAWTVNPSGNSYLYWDINTFSGLRTFGITTLTPSFGSVLPTSPSMDQHFFDLNDKKMKVWNGSRWIEVLRVFAGVVQNGAVLVPNSIGTQVNLNAQTAAGYILFNENNDPIRVVGPNGQSYFLTTEQPVHTQHDINNGYKIDALLIDAQSVEPIPAFYCVSWKGPRQLGIASYIDYKRPCVGISTESFGKDEVKRFITKGFLTNFNNWNFSEPAGTILFVGDRGQVTSIVPQQYSLQKIGHVVSPDTIFVDIQEIVLIENVLVTPTPTPTPIQSSLVNEQGVYIVNETGNTIAVNQG